MAPARRLTRWWPALSAGLLGLVLSITGFLLAQEADGLRVRGVLEQRAEWRADAVRRQLLRAADATEGLAAYIATEGDVGHDRFRAFARLARVAEDRNTALYWAPLVTDASRDAFVARARHEVTPDYDLRQISGDGVYAVAGRRPLYMPQLYELSFDGTPGVPGFDLLFREERRAQVFQVRDGGRSLATPPFELRMVGRRVPGFLVMSPVYGRDGMPGTLEARRATFQGATVARLRLDRLLPGILAGAGPVEEAIEIAIGAEDGAVAPVAWFDATAQKVGFTAPASQTPGVAITREFTELGQRWILTSHFPPEAASALASRSPLAWLLLGLFVTGVAATVAQRQVDGRVSAEATVSAQAGALGLWDEVFAHAAFGIAVADPQSNTLRFANPSLAYMLGRMPDEMVGLPLTALYQPDDWPRIAALARAADERGAVSFEGQHLRKDGSFLPVQIHLTTLRDAAGHPLHRVASVFDITRRRQTEEQLRQAQKMEAIGNLTGGIAHDFNNLLAIMIGNLDMAAPSAAGDPDLSELIHEALEAALRGRDVTGRLLAFARRQPLQPRTIDVNRLVTDTAALLRRTLGENLEIALALDPQPWPVVVDPVQLEAALVNLATNARDAMAGGGTLTIATGNRTLDDDAASMLSDADPGDYVVIAVTDTGAGMTEAVRRRIFEPFFTTKEVGKGSGLGLSMVFGFIKQSGGHTQVTSAVGRGTTVELWLPRPVALPVAPAVSTGGEIPRGRGERVLIVEDNDALRRLVARQLRDLGYRVDEADRAASALDQLQRNPVDLLFTDVVMPGELDGQGLARRARTIRPTIRLVLTSGFPGTRLEGFLGSRARLLGKPYRREDLARTLRAALDEPVG